MKKTHLISAVFLSGFGAWILGFVLFFKLLPNGPSDLDTPTDAAVVLTGGKGRVQYGFSLVRQGLVKKLFISGVNPKVKMPELIELQKVQTDRSALPQTYLGYNAQNTAENAAETAVWVGQENVKSIRLVTANYHIWRSLIEFSKVLPDIQIIPHPLADQVQWTYKQFGLLISEYNKFLWAWVGAWFR